MLYTIIWTILLAIQVIFIVFSILLYVLYTTWSKDGIHTQNEVTAMQVFAIFGFFASFFYFCFLIVMRKRIQLAINIIKEACKAMATMPILILMPVAQVFGVALFLIPWFIYMIYLASSGDMVTFPHPSWGKEHPHPTVNLTLVSSIQMMNLPITPLVIIYPPHFNLALVLPF